MASSGKQKAAAKKREALRKLRALMRSPRRDLLWYYDVGQQVEIMHPTGGERAYGKKAMKHLATKLGESESYFQTLLMARRFATAYTRRQVERLSKAKKKGWQLTWSHLWLLLSMEQPERLKMQKECIQNQWGTRELRSRIKEERGKTGGGGRPYDQPASLEDALRQIAHECEAWSRRRERVWFSDEGAVADAEKKKKTRRSNARERKLFHEAIAGLEQIQETLPGDLKRLRKIRRGLGRGKHTRGRSH